VKNVIAIAGSLRRASHNRALLEAATALAPEDMTLRVYDELGSIPLFNEDLEAETPESVARLRREVADADGILIATPEYNWSIPGVLKNAIDWLSRTEILANKPVAIVGASSGRWGTRLAQAALRQVLTATESRVMPAPALFVAGGAVREASSQLANVLSAFSKWMDHV
jgi:chromate reductase